MMRGVKRNGWFYKETNKQEHQWCWSSTTTKCVMTSAVEVACWNTKGQWDDSWTCQTVPDSVKFVPLHLFCVVIQLQWLPLMWLSIIRILLSRVNFTWKFEWSTYSFSSCVYVGALRKIISIQRNMEKNA